MKKNIRFSWINSLIGIVVAATLFSFSGLSGAHSVQVYLDDKLMIDQYVDFKTGAPKLTISEVEKHSQIIVKYNECGRTVTGRTITLKDDKNKVLKDWVFEGSTSGYKDPMTLTVKEVTALKQKGNNTLKLYYSSREFPEGQQIANLIVDAEPTTALK
jgi:hypothetical protein